MSDDEKISRLPIEFKGPPGEAERLLTIHERSGECNHRWFFVRSADGVSSRMVSVTYLVREGETEVECGRCHVRLDPMFVLRLLAHEETKWHRARATYQDEMKRLNQRKRTKCRKCGEMTDISRN